MNNIRMISVSSSNVGSIGYDSSKNNLYVIFLNGGEYLYAGVPERLYKGLLNAESVGRYLNAHIKGVYPYTKIR